MRTISESDTVTEPDEALGVKQSPVFDTVIVDPRAWDDSGEPRPEIAALRPGDLIRLGDREIEVSSVGERVSYGKVGVFDIGIPPLEDVAVSRLVVDRDPYLWTICNGPIIAVDPADVEAIGSKKTNKEEA